MVEVLFDSRTTRLLQKVLFKMVHPERKPVASGVMSSGETFALCDDGSFWIRRDTLGDWHESRPVPGTQQAKLRAVAQETRRLNEEGGEA